jgi:hypothetical protein
MKNRPFFRIFPKVASEGYCCMFGYLSLCRARGETKQQMANWLGINFWTVKYNYRCLKQGRHTCQKLEGCLKPIIDDLQPPDGAE